MKLIRLAAAAALASIFAGCAANTDVTEENAGTTEEGLSYTSLVGTWDADTGPISKIEFTRDYAESLGGFLKGHSFHATVDNGIRCITAPCPSTSDVSGIYAIKNGKLTLTSYDKPAAFFGTYIGEYTVKIKSDKLTLKKTDHTVEGTFHKAPAGVPCGDNVCTGTTYCCNPVMGICAPRGMMCIQ